MTTETGIRFGSLPELIVFKDLVRRDLEHGVDFYYQFPIFGFFLEPGSKKLDFFFANPPGLAINVQGEYWHYDQGSHKIAGDELLREMLASDGIRMVFIDESDVLRDVRYYVSEALNFRDHSRLR